MKLHITKEDWDELSESDKILWIKYFCIQTRTGVIPCSDDFKNELYPNIGQMIEFLGNSWFSMYGVTVEKGGRVSAVLNVGTIDELCDDLWEATKYKLK